MSIDPDDSVLEEALRSDLPSTDAQERMRRRLLAAGLAVGNGMAVTTSAAAGTTTATTAGLAAKLLGSSWGIKLGLAAAITIPSVGLILDAQSEPRAAVSAPSALPPAPVVELIEPVQPVAAVEGEAQSPVEPSRPAKPVTAPVAAPAPVVDLAQPSQATFTAPTEEAPKPGSTLAEETRLLDGAFAALSAGDRQRASALVAEHQAKFPNGLLQKERQRAKAKLSEGLRGE